MEVVEVVDKKDTSASKSKNKKSRNKNKAKNPQLSEEVPAEKNPSVDAPKSEPEKVEIPAESTPEIKPEAHSEHAKPIHTEVKVEAATTHTKVPDEVTVPHEESKSEDKVPEPVAETAPIVSYTEKDNKDEGDIDVIENPANKAIFTHFVKTTISETKAGEHADEEIKEHIVHDNHKIDPAHEVKIEPAHSEAKVPIDHETKIDEPENKTIHKEIKEVPAEIKPEEHLNEMITTEPVEDKFKDDHHETSEKADKDFYTIKSSEVEPYYKKFEQEKKSSTSEERKDAEEHFYECEFSVQYETKFGENIIVVGSIEELGSWDPIKGLNLTWNPSHRWTGTLKFSTLPFEYKYACKSAEETTWEKGINRAVTEQPSKPLIDIWQPI